MKERPILFSAPMVRAILDGRKTVTRRIVKGAALDWLQPGMFTPAYTADPENNMCPYGDPGDRLWVKETWRVTSRWNHLSPRDLPFERGMTIAYAAGGSRAHDDGAQYANDDDYSPWSTDWMGKTRVSIHMPRAASRITLEVTGVRVDRLQDITPDQAISEGIEGTRPSDLCTTTWRDYSMSERDLVEWFGNPVDSFRSLWESINGAGSWNANPWVWVVEFQRIPQAYAEATAA